MNGLVEPVSSPDEVNCASGHSAAHISTIISEPAIADTFRNTPSMTARPTPSSPSMNRVSAHQVPAIALNADWNGPTVTWDRKPLVGEPPLIQARALGVA